MSVNCFTDGSASKNGIRNAVGGYACHFPEHKNLNIEKVVTSNVTNNRCEYMAVIDAIRIFNSIEEFKDKKLIIYSDSQLLINTVQIWMHDWKKNGWTRKSNKPLENLDLVKELYELCKDNERLELVKVSAHEKDDSYNTRMNNIVDEMSRCYKKKSM